jgi:CheY-like chemotaxis protein
MEFHNNRLNQPEINKNPKTILVVDDEPGYREMIQFELTARGHIVLTAGGGQDALKALAENKIDLVITDMKMHPMDGLDVILEIKKKYPEIAIVVMTGYAINERVQRALEMAKRPCLRKPFNIEELWEVVPSN